MSVAREQFGSRLGFILAAAGSAVGIGNLVGFPVAAAKNGGAAFLLIYALFVFLVCLPIMMAELSMGRHSQKDPLGAYRDLSNGSSLWSLAGWLVLITPYMIAVFYMVITVWLCGYLFETASGNLDQLANPDNFGRFINSNSVFLYFIVVAALVNLILIGGVKDGIERAAKIMMPALFVMLIALVIFVLTLDNAWLGVQYYLVPDFSKINAGVINSALSQAFFSLSLGMGIMITYGSYIGRDEKIVGSAKIVALTDTGVAFAAGLMILPAIFSFNPTINTAELSDSSVSLIFTFLPKIFLALQTTIGYLAASIAASLFFLLVFFAAMVYPPQKNLRLGKDLRGGVTLLYSVKIDRSENASRVLDQVIQVLKDRINEHRTPGQQEF
ncbi:MAG TPA: sodium-dependent transporter [Chromatiaceae bacterium]|nr:sodium-dependent transporter [Chromatiaceae bacterium]